MREKKENDAFKMLKGGKKYQSRIIYLAKIPFKNSEKTFLNSINRIYRIHCQQPCTLHKGRL